MLRKQGFIALVILVFPVSINVSGCGSNEPRVVEETEEGQFRKLAEDAAAEEDAATEQ